MSKSLPSTPHSGNSVRHSTLAGRFSVMAIALAIVILMAGISYWHVSAETDGDNAQLSPLETVASGAGDFVVTWQDDSNENDIYQILARGFHADSAESIPDFTVNSVGAGQQRFPVIATAANGDFVVAWQDDNNDNGIYQILARGFYSDGSERFPDITVNSVGAGQQLIPAIAMAANGDFVVAWQDDNNDNGIYQILARGFHSDGSERIPDFTVNSVGAGQQRDPSIAMAANGDFVIAWEDDNNDNDIYQILARGFYHDGSERFPDITVNSVGAGQQLNPAVAMAGNRDFVVAWQDDNNDNDIYQILARGFHSDGSERFPDFTVNSVGAGQQRDPAVAMVNNGDFVIAWEDDNNDNDIYQILARGFLADSAERFPDFTVNSVGAGQQRDPAVAMIDNGDFIIAWEDDNNDNDIYQILARGFHSDSSERFPDFTVNSVGAGQQLNPAIAVVRHSFVYLPLVQ